MRFRRGWGWAVANIWRRRWGWRWRWRWWLGCLAQPLRCRSIGRRAVYVVTRYVSVTQIIKFNQSLFFFFSHATFWYLRKLFPESETEIQSSSMQVFSNSSEIFTAGHSTHSSTNLVKGSNMVNGRLVRSFSRMRLLSHTRRRGRKKKGRGLGGFFFSYIELIPSRITPSPKITRHSLHRIQAQFVTVDILYT